MSALNVIRGADGLTVLTDGALYDDEGVVRDFMSNLLVFPHMSAAVGMCGPLVLLPELYEMTFQCSSFDEMVKVVQAQASYLGRWEQEFNCVIAGYSGTREAFEIYLLPGHDQFGTPAFRLIPLPGNCLLPMPYPEIAGQIGWNMPALNDLDAERDGLQLMECQRRDRSSGHYVVGGFVQQTTITRTGISSQIIKYWPDEVGRQIEPEKDDVFVSAPPAFSLAGVARGVSRRKTAAALADQGYHRTFTMGNLGVMKDMMTGMPKDVIAMIERAGGFKEGSIESEIPQVGDFSKGMARRKAMMVVALDIALMYAGNSVLQSIFNVMLGDRTIDEEAHGYTERFKKELNKIEMHPAELLQPFSIAERLSATGENEPKRKDRIRIGYQSDGTAIYARNPVGKIGEEFIGWMTSPLEMAKRKGSTYSRPALEVLSNDKGYGRKVYDPNAETPAEYGAIIWAIVEHFMKAQVPEQQINAASDLIKGEGDPKTNVLQLVGPFAGETFSRGAPGGPAVGEMYDSRSRREIKINMAMPDIRRQIMRGDLGGAMQRMQELQVEPGFQRFIIRTTINPATRLSGRSLREFYRNANDDQRERMERARQ